MTAKEIFGTGVRLLGLWLLVKAFAVGSSAFSYYNYYQLSAFSGYSEQFPMHKVSIFIAIAYLLFGFLFIKFPHFIAGLLIPKTAVDTSQVDWSEEVIERIGFVLMGVYFVAVAIPQLLQNFGLYIPMHNMPFDDSSRGWGFLVLCITNLVRLSIGLILVFKSRGLVRMIHKLRR